MQTPSEVQMNGILAAGLDPDSVKEHKNGYFIAPHSNGEGHVAIINPHGSVSIYPPTMAEHALRGTE